MALSRLLDTVLDRAVPARYSRAGFALRRRGWPADDPRPDALRGKTVLVTGANSGIGKAITEASAALGASVLMTARDRTRGEDACAQIRAAVPNADVQVLVCDVANLAAVRAFAADVTDRRRQVDVLIQRCKRRRAGTAHGVCRLMGGLRVRPCERPPRSVSRSQTHR
jgi:dehydrogenase/reductase SDR family member 12